MLSLAGSAVILAVIFNFFIYPQIKKINALDKEISSTRITLSKYLGLLARKDSLQDQYKKFNPQSNASTAEKDSVVLTLSALEDMAGQAGIRILDIRPQGTKDSRLYQEVFIDLKAEASLENFLNFIYHLENSLSLFRITKLQLLAKPNTQFLEATFSISQISLPN